MSVVTTSIPKFASDPERLKDLPLGQNQWTKPRRDQALARYLELGLPTLWHEEWRSTNLAPLIKTEFDAIAPEAALTQQQLDELKLPELGPNRLVFVNGSYSEAHSNCAKLPNGAIVGSLRQHLDHPVLKAHLFNYAQEIQAPFVALNSAFFTDGCFVFLPANTALRDPLHFVFIGQSGSRNNPFAVHLRNLIVAGAHSSGKAVFHYFSGNAVTHFDNIVTEVVLEENAHFNCVKLNRENIDSFHIETIQAAQAAHSTFTHTNLTLGGRIVRNDVDTVLNGSGAHANLWGLTLIGGRQLVDNHTDVRHAAAHCTSWEVYKGIYDQRSQGVFNGKIVVHPKAQKTDAKQSNRNLLLSDQATIMTKPQLEIFADDVKCTHGATIGQLDDNAIFYLQSRGIPKDEAKALLTYAFASEILAEINHEEFRAYLQELVRLRLPQLQQVVCA